MKLRYILISVFIIAILIVGTIFVFPKLIKNTNTSGTASTTTPATAQQEQTTNTTNTTSNQPSATATTTVTVPQEMQTVIDTNTDEIFVDNSKKLATSYPNQLIPLYGVLDVADSYQITNANGDPGWTTTYVSGLATGDIVSFYRPLLENQSNYSEDTVSDSTYLDATVSGYSISITVSPNNSQKTDMPGNSSVTIFIEQI
ncbi:hypothetical protein GH810_07590 [Acetobacterium paludosum]|uniref:Uncharacterized protein n=1 Tax=Acetobacterium paludosum TaxID=52693 RepID=A0A923KWK8_9FIRM|nr:hypothetical protein [Acetobacterium paludosum]MBC3888168.1 hypothetical protein [Acetobacterium paludosum]